MIPWDENARIFHRIPLEGGPPAERAVHIGPLNSLIEIAINGLEGPLENLVIRTDSGVEYEPQEILELSRMPERPLK